MLAAAEPFLLEPLAAIRFASVPAGGAERHDRAEVECRATGAVARRSSVAPPRREISRGRDLPAVREVHRAHRAQRCHARLSAAHPRLLSFRIDARAGVLHLLWRRANGKSTLLNVLRAHHGRIRQGDADHHVPGKARGRAGSEHSVDIARLPAVRLVTAVEPPEGRASRRGPHQGFHRRRNDQRARSEQGHHRIPAVHQADHRVQRAAADPRRRSWHLAPHPAVSVHGADPGSEIDRDLERKLLAEAEGILQWMLTGFEEWSASGLAPPPEAREALEVYRATQDYVGEFIETRCVLTGDRIDPASTRPTR
jgi:hypothetical protein